VKRRGLSKNRKDGMGWANEIVKSTYKIMQYIDKRRWIVASIKWILTRRSVISGIVFAVIFGLTFFFLSIVVNEMEKYRYVFPYEKIIAFLMGSSFGIAFFIISLGIDPRKPSNKCYSCSQLKPSKEEEEIEKRCHSCHQLLNLNE